MSNTEFVPFDDIVKLQNATKGFLLCDEQPGKGRGYLIELNRKVGDKPTDTQEANIFVRGDATMCIVCMGPGTIPKERIVHKDATVADLLKALDWFWGLER